MLIDRDTPEVTLTDSDAAPPSGGETCLVSIHGPNLGRRWSLDLDEMIVGRDPHEVFFQDAIIFGK